MASKADAIEDYLESSLKSLAQKAEMERYWKLVKELDKKERFIMQEINELRKEEPAIGSFLRKSYENKIHRLFNRAEECGAAKIKLLDKLSTLVDRKVKELNKGLASLVSETGIESHHDSFDVDIGSGGEKEDETVPIEESDIAEKVTNLLKLQTIAESSEPQEEPGSVAGKQPDKEKPAEEAVGSSDDDTLYCFCRQPEDGLMIGCDYAECPYEWFHMVCLQMTKAPEGEWYCDHCKTAKSY